MSAPLRPACGPPPGIVDVWTIALDDPALAHAELAATLDHDERRRAGRMRAGREWAAARGARRMILASYMDVSPTAIRYTELGKPALALANGIRFSSADTAGFAVVAVASDREVGVDVEREGENAEAVLDALPGLGEQIRRLPPERRGAALLAHWVRFEATLKVSGTPLWEGLRHELSIGTDVFAPPARTIPPTGVVARDLELRPGYAVAVAATGDDWSVRIREFSPATLHV